MGYRARTGVLCALKVLRLLLLALLSPNLALDLLGERKVGLLALLHVFVVRLGGLLDPQALEDLADAVDIFRPDAVNVAVERALVGERRARRKEFEEVRGEEMGARHGLLVLSASSRSASASASSKL